MLVIDAHQMGCNSLVARLSGDNLLRVVSGGDDQSLAVLTMVISKPSGGNAGAPHGDINGDDRSHASSGVESSMCLQVVAAERVAGASGSALKGVGLDPTGRFLFAVGYDQRLSRWHVLDPDQTWTHPEPVGVSSGSSPVLCRVSSVQDGVGLRWESASLCDVSDVAGLGIADEGLAVVFGQGFQVFGIGEP